MSSVKSSAVFAMHSKIILIILVFFGISCEGAVWGPDKGEDQCETAIKETILEDRSTIVDETGSRLHSTWLSQECEVRAGPEYVIRKYTFFDNGTFLLLRHHYAEESCSVAMYTVSARGVIRLLSSSTLAPGATEARYQLDRVHIVPLTRQVAQKFSHRVNVSCNPQPKWRPYMPQLVYEQPSSRFTNFLWEGPKYNAFQRHHSASRKHRGLDCLEPLGIEFGELRLVRVQKRSSTSVAFALGSNRTPRIELLLGSLPPNVYSRKTHRSTSLQPTPLLRADTTKGCLVCGAISRGTESSPPVLHEVAALPALLGGFWLSSSCESCEGGMWIKRQLAMYAGDMLWTGRWDYYADPRCSTFLYAVTAAGSYIQRAGRQRRHGEIDRDPENFLADPRMEEQSFEYDAQARSARDFQPRNIFRTKRSAKEEEPEIGPSGRMKRSFDEEEPERPSGRTKRSADEEEPEIGPSGRTKRSADEEEPEIGPSGRTKRSADEEEPEMGPRGRTDASIEYDAQVRSARDFQPRSIFRTKRSAVEEPERPSGRTKRSFDEEEPERPSGRTDEPIDERPLKTEKGLAEWMTPELARNLFEIYGSKKEITESMLPTVEEIREAIEGSGSRAETDLSPIARARPHEDSSADPNALGDETDEPGSSESGKIGRSSLPIGESAKSRRSLDGENSYRHLLQNAQPSIADAYAAMLRGNQRREETTKRPVVSPVPAGTTELDLHVAESLLVAGDLAIAARCGAQILGDEREIGSRGLRVRPLSTWPRSCVQHALEAPSTLGLRARVGVNWSGQYTLLLGPRDDNLWEAPLHQCGPTPSHNPALRVHLRRSVGLRYGLYTSSAGSIIADWWLWIMIHAVLGILGR